MDLEELLSALGPQGPEVLIGPGDDAGVMRPPEGGLLVQTVDVITPVVDEPSSFGAISAVNSLSDIYAMGGQPHSALAILGFSSCDYDKEVVKDILRGASRVLQQAGVSLLGGHSFEDPELKFGLAVSGTVREPILRAQGAREGELLVLTKPIGVGVLSTALKAQKITQAQMQEAIQSMLTLNDKAARAARAAGASAMTDITGFGLLGHALSMLKGSELDFHLELSRVPVFERTREFIARGIVPEGAYNNLRFLQGRVDWEGLAEEEQLLLADPQTSGGLLISLPQDGLETFRRHFGPVAVIGRTQRGSQRLKVRP